jgi:hypothetical protein
MLLRMCGLGVVLLALGAGVLPGVDDPEVVGKVKAVNVKEKSFIITLEDKTERTFLVDKATKFTGPRGSNREDGLKDECMRQGYEIRVVPGGDAKLVKENKGQLAKEIKLPAWKAEAKKKGG